ncbi:MAG: hypothetical protein KatS3mg104_1118 [Phycisphaerae bacterium]|jgi:hypothetical protein|nr:MAG: hypothetical protein KatS3mg104_1118 [Phycisphaerae bacterium]
MGLLMNNRPPIFDLRIEPVIDPSGQTQRKQKLLTAHRESRFELFSDSGVYKPNPNFDWRGYFWNAASFLSDDTGRMHARANAMLRLVASLGDGHFWTSAATVLLGRFGKDSETPRITSEVDQLLRDRLRGLVLEEATHRPRGYNDNYPAMAALSAGVGARLTDQPDALQGARVCLEEFARLYHRRGFLSEYASPTYSPITLTMLAEIVNLSDDPFLRDLALSIEQRLWLELVSRWHVPTSSLSGPHSRAYMADMCAHYHSAHVAMYLGLGEEFTLIHPFNSQFPGLPGQALHNGGPDVAFQATSFHHPPSRLVEILRDRKYPHQVIANAEVASFSRNAWSHERHPETPFCEVPANVVNTTNYQTPDYALGTSDRSWLDGKQHTGVHLVFRRSRSVQSLKDIGSLFARYLFGPCDVINRHRHLDCGGRTIGLQHESSCMVLYWPRPSWGASRGDPDPERSDIGLLQLVTFIPNFWTAPQEIWIGDTPLADCDSCASSPSPVFIHDGRVFVVIQPLEITDLGRSAAVRVDEVNGFRAIRFINYESTPRRFRADELPAIRNGFVLKVVSCDTHNFSEWRHQWMNHFRFTDQWHAGDAMRRVRATLPEGVELGMEISPYSEGIKCRTINGQAAPEPLFQATGIDTKSLPLI